MAIENKAEKENHKNTEDVKANAAKQEKKMMDELATPTLVAAFRRKKKIKIKADTERDEVDRESLFFLLAVETLVGWLLRQMRSGKSSHYTSTEKAHLQPQ